MGVGVISDPNSDPNSDPRQGPKKGPKNGAMCLHMPFSDFSDAPVFGALK